MDLWQRAKVFAEEAAKRAEEAAKRSQELTKGAARLSQEFVSETAKKSKELAVEATKAADQIKTEALRRADQIKALAGDIPIPVPNPLTAGATSVSFVSGEPSPELEKFGITDELTEFVKGLTINTFRDFPMEDDANITETTESSNVRKDLNEWQANHATLLLSTVKEISKFRYDLCPRYMKERKFWRIYFILVNSYVAPCEKQYMEKLGMESIEATHSNLDKQSSGTTPALKEEMKESKLQTKPSTSSTAEQDLDVFLLGDLGSDEEPDDGPDDDDDDDDDFDKLGGTSGLDTEDEDEATSKQPSKTAK